MAARWVGLSRPSNKKTTARAVAKQGVLRDCLHALGASSALLMAAAMNFALYPEALAAVVGSEHSIVGFVPAEPAAGAPPPAAAPVAVDEEEVRLLAATAWGEARSEGADGMRAVAHVIVNRVGQRFGDDLETVIRAPKQFSAWNVGDPNRPLVQNPERYATGGANLETWRAAQEIAREVLSGQSVDPTNGALFYHTRAIRPWWSRYGHGATAIGAHIFYRDVPDQAGRHRRGGRRVTQIADNAPGERGPRAGRVNGVIQYAPVSAARQELPSETATLTGLPAPATASMAANEPIATVTPVSSSAAP
jgi:spore germination cell wall hydrolase CwlJ-like protein